MAESRQEAKWGIVSTIKAPAEAILNFAAYHLEAGAHRLFIYLDAPCPEARPLLKAHPKIRVFDCDDASWQRRRKKTGRPEKHQVRQSLNATRAYRRQSDDLDWLAHIDVDEFLWAKTPISDILAALPKTSAWARTRPIEMLSQDHARRDEKKAFKGHIPASPERGAIVARLYPQFGEHLKGGFLSHIEGKFFIRTGLPNVSLRIHNAFQNQQQMRHGQELPEVDLCHLHATNWEQWQHHYRFRLERGSYRGELKPARPREKGGVTLHELLRGIETRQGIEGLRAFFEEVSHDSPELRSRLTAEGLLQIRDLDLDARRRRHFPNFGQGHAPSD